MKPETPAGEGEDGLLPREEAEDPHRGAELGDHRSQSRSGDAHVEEEDEDGVQNGVQHRPQEHRHHPRAAEALGIDEGVHAERQHHRNGPDEIDQKILPPINHSGVAAPYQIENGVQKEVEHRHQRRPQHQEVDKGVAHDPLGLLVVPMAPGDGEERSAPHAGEVGKGGNDIHHRHHQADSGEGVPAHVGDVADEHTVHHIVQHHRQLSHRHGHRQGQNTPGNGALREVVLTLFHANFSLV